MRNEEFPKQYEIINKGISGNRTIDLYARIKKDVWNLQPDVLSILIGVNDVWHELGSKNGVEPERFERIYRMILDDTLERLPNIKIMLLEPFFLRGTAVEALGYEGFTQVYDYAKVVRKLADEYKLTFVPLQAQFNAMAEKYGAEYYLYDGVHPSVAGATLIANGWMKGFRKLAK